MWGQGRKARGRWAAFHVSEPWGFLTQPDGLQESEPEALFPPWSCGTFTVHRSLWSQIRERSTGPALFFRALTDLWLTE